MRRFLLVLVAILVVVMFVGVPGLGHNDPPPMLDETLPPLTIVNPGPFEFERLDCASAILIEAESGEVIFAQNADEVRAPASIAKMTLELIVLEMVKRGDLTLDEPIRASGWASKIGGSQVYLKQGEVFPLRELMKAVCISSANDACVAIAEHIAGHADVFVDFMNRRVREMGLEHSRYVNVHGLDDEYEDRNQTTAREVAMIGRELIRFPEIREWSQMTREPFRDGEFILENTNTLIGRFAGMDGIKTGYTARAGYNLCASAERDGARYITVVMGAKTRESCAIVTSRLLTRAFHEINPVAATTTGTPLSDPPIQVGLSSQTIHPVAARDVKLFLSTVAKPRVEVRSEIRHPLEAPLLAGSLIGEAAVVVDGNEVARVPLVSDQAVEPHGFRAWLRGKFGL